MNRLNNSKKFGHRKCAKLMKDQIYLMIKIKNWNKKLNYSWTKINSFNNKFYLVSKKFKDYMSLIKEDKLSQ